MAERKFASVKFGARFVDEARNEAALLHRSVASQIEHWATLGRAVERAPGVTIEHVRAALRGNLSVDDLTAEEQETFFSLLGDHFDTPSAAALAFFAARRGRGGGVGLDEKGNLARALAGGGSVKISGHQ